MCWKSQHLPLRAAILAVAALSGSGLAQPPAPEHRPSADSLARPCLACHAGHDRAVIPRLQGMPEARFVGRMREFRDRRADSVMHRIARGYRDQDYAGLARYFHDLGRTSR